MIIGALLCVLYMGVAAETNLNQQPAESTISQAISQPDGQGGETGETTSLPESSSRYGQNAVDPTVGNNENDFDAPASSSQKVSSKNNTHTSSAITGIVSIEVTTSNVSYETPVETSSEVISEEPSSSEESSSRYGYNAVDPTVGNNENDFDDPASDMSIDLEVLSKEDEGGEKNIFNLSKLLKGLIFIPIVLALASVGALIYVNRKEFAGAKAKKKDKKETSGKDARKKNNK